jgi:hypothetical protein
MKNYIMPYRIKKYYLGPLFVLAAIVVLGSFKSDRAEKFYVDPRTGDDSNPGSANHPFRSLDHALLVVGQRVEKGVLSDKIFLRAGVYTKAADHTSYTLRLRGTPEDPSLISAMPCDPGASGCVQRQSGKWYENVVFDDGQIIESAWTQVEGHAGVWATKPGYALRAWTRQNLWPWRRQPGFKPAKLDRTPETALFTVAPYMLLQDGQPTVWVDSLGALTQPGSHAYDFATGTLYVFPFDHRNPNKSVFESWYGGEEIYEPGMLYLDGEGRALFKGNMEYAAIEGCEFKMFLRLFEFHRHGYKKAQDREVQRHVRIEDNFFEYGWIHFLLDANTIYEEDDTLVRVRFQDRSHWTLRNNLFYRPSREVFQVHGADHVFESNVIIDHSGPWAGPAVCCSILNARNMDSLIVRNNLISGNGNNSYNPGTIFMIEVEGRESHHSDHGDYIYKGPTYENNLITNISAGTAFVLGKGNVRMRDITIRGNILATNDKGAAIQLASPQKNLTIENNIFYDQSMVISVYGRGAPMKNPALPTTIDIRNNIFLNNHKLIDDKLFDSHQGSIIAIENNAFSDSDRALGTGSVKTDLRFVNPEHFDFRCNSAEGAGPCLKGIGPGGDDPNALLDRWRTLFDTLPKALPVL